MSSDGPSAYVSQAEFSRLKGVSRKTATIWKQKGWLVVTDAGLVDVAATEALLAQRPITYRGGSTVAPGSVTATVTDAPVTKRNGKGNSSSAGDSGKPKLANHVAVRRKLAFRITRPFPIEWPIWELCIVDDLNQSVSARVAKFELPMAIHIGKLEIGCWPAAQADRLGGSRQ